jgi:hypothetical protein
MTYRRLSSRPSINSYSNAILRSGRAVGALRFVEGANVLVCFDHVVRIIVNANHSIMRPAAMLGVVDCVQHSMGWKCKAFWMFMLKSILEGGSGGRECAHE